MNFVALSLFLLISSASPAQRELPEKTENSLDQLIREAFEYARWILQRHEPISFPSIPEQEIIFDDVNLKFSTKNVRVSKLTDFIIEDISNNWPALNASYWLTFPQAFLDGSYEVSGVAFGKNVQGSGTFTVAIDTFTQTGRIKYTIIEHFLQVQNLELDYQLAGAKFHVQGLKIAGLTQEDVENFLNENLLSYMNEKKDVLCQALAGRVMFAANQVLYGHSPQDILNWLKNIVVSTPDPPPFP